MTHFNPVVAVHLPSRGRLSLMSKTVVLALAALWLWCGVSACTAHSELPVVSVSFRSPSGSLTPQLQVEVVSTPQGRAKGLMFRTKLPENRGMLFIFPEEIVHSFWMKNTYIPLDMVFVARNRSVVGVVENATPLTEDSRAVPHASMYVLEFAAGVAKKLGIAPGSTLEIVGTLPEPL